MIRGKLLGFQKTTYKKKIDDQGHTEDRIRCDAYFDLGKISEASGFGNHTTTVTAWGEEHAEWFFNELSDNKYLGSEILVDTFGSNNSLAQSHIVMKVK